MQPDALIKSVRNWIDAAERVVVLTGAGISTDSGIPDFRGPNGVWTREPEAEKLATLQHYLGDAEIRKNAWQRRLSNPGWTAEPNSGHAAIVALEQRGKLHALITQNIDGLHQKAGNSPERVIEVHGTMHSALCWTCGWRGPMRAVLGRVRAGEADPACQVCGGVLKSATIMFGEALVPEVIEHAMRVAVETDLLLAVGTSLQVYPAAGTVPAAKAAGARVVIVNAEPTPLDSVADAVLRTPIGVTLPRLVA